MQNTTNISFKTLSQKISTCKKCILRSSCSQVVVGSGSERSEILFIGEAPGKKEDEIGMPFVGASGKLLQEMLASIGMNRESVYITNIVKCRPPNNRDPLPEEIALCTPWLTAQIERMDPKLIITLGRHSMNFFLPELKISTSHGHIYRAQPTSFTKPFVFFTLYHPAAALYNGGLRDSLFKDFSKIPKILKEIKKN